MFLDSFDSGSGASCYDDFGSSISRSNAKCIRSSLLCRHLEWLLIVGRKTLGFCSAIRESTVERDGKEFPNEASWLQQGGCVVFLFPGWKRGNIGRGWRRKTNVVSFVTAEFNKKLEPGTKRAAPAYPGTEIPARLMKIEFCKGENV